MTRRRRRTMKCSRDEECVLVNRGMWGTSRDEIVCTGCGRRLDTLGVTWVEAYSTDDIDKLLVYSVADLKRDLR